MDEKKEIKITPKDVIKQAGGKMPKAIMIQRGMTIQFYNCKYKCISVKPNGIVKLRFKGFVNPS